MKVRCSPPFSARLLPLGLTLLWLLSLPLLAALLLCWVGVALAQPGAVAGLWAGILLFLVIIACGTGLCLVTLWWWHPPRRSRKIRRLRPAPPREVEPETPESWASPAPADRNGAPEWADEPVESKARRKAGDAKTDCVLDRDIWEQLSEYLQEYPRNERGGVLLGYRDGKRVFFSAAIFPEQKESTSTRCEFPTRDVALVREAHDAVANVAGNERLELVTAWIHTHPHLTVFLSGTDRETIKEWKSLDRKVTAAVVDVFEPDFESQLGVFDSECKPLSVSLGNVPLSAELSEEFRRAVDDVFVQNQRPSPFLALAAVAKPRSMARVH